MAGVWFSLGWYLQPPLPPYTHTSALQVADFGLSKQRQQTYVTGVTSLRGTLPWTAPEIIRTPKVRAGGRGLAGGGGAGGGKGWEVGGGGRRGWRLGAGAGGAAGPCVFGGRGNAGLWGAVCACGWGCGSMG